LTVLGVAGPAGSVPVAVVSPLVELGSALHVLRDPGHHDADEWAAGVRAGMSRRLAESVRQWSWTTQAIRATPFVTAAPIRQSPAPIRAGAADDLPAALDRLREEPPHRVAGQLLRPIAPTGAPAAALRWARARGPAVAAQVQALVDDPGRAVADFVDFLARCWDEWFAEEWARCAPALRRRARRFADTVAAHGAVRALSTLDPAITPSAGGDGLSVGKVAQGRHDVSRRGLAVAPSTFIRPHLYVGDASATRTARLAAALGDFCESLHDLVAHVLMWDEINLAVLAEAAAGRVTGACRRGGRRPRRDDASTTAACGPAAPFRHRCCCTGTGVCATR
jgi:hypothetical protein